MDIPLGWLIEEIMLGTEYALTALLLLFIAYLIYEVTSARKRTRECEERSFKERESALSELESIRKTFIDKSEDMLTKYHSTMSSQNEKTDRLTDMVRTLITLIQMKK